MEENKLNVYGRMSLARKMFVDEKVRKNKTNSFAKYNYYDLNQIYPTLNRILESVGLFSHIQINEQIAILTIINVDDPTQEILFSMPTIKAELAKSTEIQSWGSTVSYLSRYLLLTAFQIGEEEENDIDSTSQSEARSGGKSNNQKPKPETKSSEIITDSLEALKNEVTELCKEVSLGGDRAKVAEIVKANNNNNMNPKSITDIGVAKKILEELKAIQ